MTPPRNTLNLNDVKRVGTLLRMTKKCPQCRKTKEASEFYKSRRLKSRLSSWCKACHTARGKTRDYTAIYHQKRLNLPMKVRVHRLVHQRLRAGTLKKGPCFFCGEPKTEGHHIFYEYPVTVLWLCHKHHVQFHQVWKATE